MKINLINYLLTTILKEKKNMISCWTPLVIKVMITKEMRRMRMEMMMRMMMMMIRKIIRKARF